ncbi:MAG: CdaR family protein [Synergistaceae bacterium]|nr:CdaR family protein [Synergistaceae bacterium]
MSLSNKLDEMLTSRWVLWAVSVAIASSMWFFVGGGDDKNETRKLLARIEYLNLQPQIAVRSAVSEILIEIAAPAGVMENLTYDSIICEVDLRGFSSGKYRPAVRPRLPPNVILRSMSPSELDIELIRQIARVLTVEVVLPQDIPVGQYLEAVEVVPREINVRGAEGDMAKIGSVSIAPTFLELQTGKELMLPVNITQSQPFEDEVVLEPSQVRINAVLVTGMPRKRVPVNVRLAGKPSDDYEVKTLTTDPAEVMIQGARESLDRISAVDTETVDITNLSASQTVVIPLRAFADREVSTVNVSSVRLSIHLEPIVAQKLFSNVELSVDGAAAQTRWRAEPRTVDVTVEAPPSIIETLDSESHMRAFVDVSGIFLRRAVLPVWVTPASDNLKVVKVEPATVTVSALEE